MFFSKAWKFLKKNLFYVGLVVCVVTICGVAIISSLPKQKDSPTEIVDKQESETLKEAQDNLNKESDDKAENEPTATKSSTNSSPSALKGSSSSSKPAAASNALTKPLDGEIINSFSDTTLVFNSTVNMWMTHNGIDISCEKSTDVLAALPGEVSSVISDDSKGKIVKVTHVNSTVTIYAGLDDVIVEEGSKVNAAQKLGTAGTPAFESDLGPHLHFEYIVNEVYKDPTEYFS